MPEQTLDAHRAYRNGEVTVDEYGHAVVAHVTLREEHQWSEWTDWKNGCRYRECEFCPAWMGEVILDDRSRKRRAGVSTRSKRDASA